MSSVRAFIAVLMPEEVKSQLARVQGQLASPGLQVTWVRPQAMHLTLKFLGDMPVETVPEIVRVMRQAVAAVQPFGLTLNGIGGFPNLSYPRVLWVDWLDTSGRLIVLQKDLEEALAALGIPRERRAFTPHLTLGRVKSMRRKGQLLRQVQLAEKELRAEVSVDAIALLSSELHPRGAIHTVLESLTLPAQAQT